ncbi:MULTISPECIES: LLM class flavin-dependent oxidoreductase [unclassified Streptococcus]|uniref:LLM class flavin-dependent oxidoreductase n=1 Tax=unclassified Streptococcus TaxID=2608887 RepID=UPI0010727BAC|nr:MULTISPECIES: LLM class flavin-dependent oxidoreductase [unclassified Streptococcus]MBF0786719.1 LLM class flavin-dependent oxidoreductase [Streptococcus sp. 19428wC2_LYSM12]MCQ9211673.1 LLM class flavin-dependent oxidoreductase [Streptococcus sp. B01]MCQ9213138.1 LLM class flavin-dependent oxidoreductase [Streptococcus sp. O1]TFV06469.1 LLM class flavin-dependent oxidoreductase [Streptococcus sp. LYSM12]
MVELGISTFGETTLLERTGQAVDHAERIRNLVEEIELADQVGLDIYAIGEHHREDFAVSAPEIVLAAGAVKTKRIRLSSAVTVLSSVDPVRVYQQYATIDALSNGRAEIMVGRGSFTESFPLFGYDLRDYEDLFDEKLEMLLAIKDKIYLNWQGQHTQSVENRPVYPRAVQDDFPIKVATGGSPESTQKIAALGLPIVYAIIGSNPRYFKPLVEMYRKIGRLKGHDEEKMTVGAHSWGWIAEDKEQAERDYFYPTKQLVDAISKDRPFWKELTYEAYRKNIAEDGAMFVGDPDTVADKMIQVIEELKLDSFMLHIPVGSMPHEDTLKAIRLYGEKVAPKVRAYFSTKGQ